MRSRPSQRSAATGSLWRSDTEATSNQAAAGFSAGARALTHTFNAMPPITGRDPGPIGAAIDNNDVHLTVIADRVHVHDANLRLLFAVAGNRIVAVTDAIAAAGSTIETSMRGEQPIGIANGSARLTDGTLASSILTMDQALRNLIEIGIEPRLAIRALTSNPARLMSRDDLGYLRLHGPADVVVMDNTFTPLRTLIHGQEIQ